MTFTRLISDNLKNVLNVIASLRRMRGNQKKTKRNKYFSLAGRRLEGGDPGFTSGELKGTKIKKKKN